METSKDSGRGYNPGLKLRFINSPSSLIFTSSRIMAIDGSPVAIELVEAVTNTRVTLHPLSSSRLDIVALNNDLTGENWTTEEFNRNIACPREGRRPLLVGDLTVTLKDGVGVIRDNVAFADNSNLSTNNCKFRLGARATKGGGVVEAISEVFVCMNLPGRSHGKHHPPYPDSEVWRLRNLRKDSRFTRYLTEKGIHTVKDLRRCLAINPKALHRILGKRLSKKRCDVIVSHAMGCVLNEAECYVYDVETLGAFLLLNSVYEVMKVSLDGVMVLDVSQLTYSQKEVLAKLKNEAYKNVDKFVPVENSLQKYLLCARDPRFSIDSRSKYVNERPDSPIYRTGYSARGQFLGSQSKNEPDSPEIMSDCSNPEQVFESQRNVVNEEPDSPGNMSDGSATDQVFESQRNVVEEEPDSPGNMSDGSATDQVFESQRNVVEEEPDSPGSMGECSATGQVFESQINVTDEDSDSPRSMGECSATGQVFGSPRKVANEGLIESSVRGEIFGTSNRSRVSSSSAEYDVVFRYRKGDISNDFISHLKAALCRRGISVDEDFDEVSTQVQAVDAVPDCRVLIVFLTNRYVLSDLPNILEHQRRKDRVVFPIFDGLSPSDLISNNKSYERFFLKEEPKRWWDALKEIAQMSSYILTDKSESELIDKIVEDVLKVLSSNDNHKDNIIGINMQVEKILSLLCIESLDVCSIGIWGTVGVGKTTIVEEICRRISTQYETCVFIKNLHGKVELEGHDAVTEKLLSKILDIEPHVLRISAIKSSFLRSRLQRKRVLIILDDVNDFRDVETYLGKLNYFGPGSRIIITSRNRRVFIRSKVDHVYEVKPLDTSKSLLLLCRGTMQSVVSQKAYEPQLLELVRFANGNPQVLRFLGEEMSCRSVGKWDWFSQVIQQTSSIFIPHIFERSCCGLDDNERSIFLDIACFFRRMDKDNVAMLLNGCGFSAHVGFRSLVDKSLLSISNNLLDMHSFIQATGREVVCQESVNRPGKRSRLWHPEDIRDAFIYDRSKLDIEGIFLDTSKLKLDAKSNVFETMCNLRLLKIYCSKVIKNRGVSLPQGLEYLPSKLRLLHWEYYPLSSLPQNFDPKNLVELNLPSSCAKRLWKGKKTLEKLRRMKLSYSYQLTKIPRFSSTPNLELLDLEGCNSLLSISQSISYLKKLVFLNLKDCSKLESIPSMVDLESLEVLNLSGCSKLENFPDISPNVKEIYMGGTMIQEIPSSIKNLELLEKLDLENSRHLKNLPTNICKLKHLETLNISGCTSLNQFPDLSRRMKCLRFLDLSRTAIKELPSSISYMTALEVLRLVDCRNLVRLPDNAWSLRFKVEFHQIDTEKFSRLWNRLGWLKKVQKS